MKCTFPSSHSSSGYFFLALASVSEFAMSGFVNFECVWLLVVEKPCKAVTTSSTGLLFRLPTEAASVGSRCGLLGPQMVNKSYSCCVECIRGTRNHHPPQLPSAWHPSSTSG